MPFTIVRATGDYVCSRCDSTIAAGTEYVRQGSLPFHASCFRRKLKESISRYRETLTQLDKQVQESSD